MNLKEIKRGAKAAFRDGPVTVCPCPDHVRDVNQFLEETLDRLVDEIEKAVMEKMYNSWECDHKTETQEAFNRFKGENV